MGVVEHDRMCRNGTRCRKHRDLISGVIANLGVYECPGFPTAEEAISFLDLALKERLHKSLNGGSLSVIEGIINAEDRGDMVSALELARELQEIIRRIEHDI